ncbi:thymidine kinase [Propionibacterium sp.]|uniref:thymidine kinase n=1 Tax=Propionibacterium sp. TaxID=1977903 RepID=UPI0039ED20A5
MDAAAPTSAELLFFTGPMNSGKSTLALQTAHTQAFHDRQGLLFTSRDRTGTASISSRIGMRRTAIEVDAALDFWARVVSALTSGARIDFLVCDEAQFYTPRQVDQLARIVDELDIDVFCFGILTDFRSQLFPGSRRLVELADRVQTMQVQPLCWCGARGTINARVLDGRVVTEGDQVLIADTEDTPGGDGLHYEVLCRKHFRLGMGRPVDATLSPQTLPFE